MTCLLWLNYNFTIHDCLKLTKWGMDSRPIKIIDFSCFAVRRRCAFFDLRSTIAIDCCLVFTKASNWLTLIPFRVISAVVVARILTASSCEIVGICSSVRPELIASSPHQPNKPISSLVSPFPFQSIGSVSTYSGPTFCMKRNGVMVRRRRPIWRPIWPSALVFLHPLNLVLQSLDFRTEVCIGSSQSLQPS